MIVGPTLYDWPELRAATDALWRACADELRARGVAAPDKIDRSQPPAEIWRAPTVLAAQCCGADLVSGLAGVARAAATPSYAAPGCGAGTYSSAVICRPGAPWRTPQSWRDARLATNGTNSFSGWWALPAGRRAEAKILETGAHRRSIEAVRRGDADVAAIDAVVWALAQDIDPSLTEALSVVEWTDPAPAPPFITTLAEPDVLHAALAEAIQNAGAEAARTLRLCAVAPPPTDGYAHVAARRPHGA